MNIHSDNPDIEKVLIRINDKVMAEGAVMAEGLEIASKNGEMSILSSGAPTADPLIRMPHNCLLPYDAFTLALEGSDIVIKSHTDKVTPLQVGLMEDMMALYNMTDKIDLHRGTSPWMTLQQAPEVLEILAQGREGKGVQNLVAAIKEGRTGDNVTLSTFFNSRLLGCKLYEPKAKKTRVLMPILDCLNHTAAGAFFQNDYPDKGRSAIYIRQSNPVPGSNECYAFYGHLDAFDSYINYGFVDQKAPVFRSVPVDIDFGKFGRIKIRGLTGVVKKTDLPDLYKDLHFHMPIINVYHDEKRAEMSHIFIPGRSARKSMRRILEFVILLLIPSISESEALGYVLKAESEILNKNIAYYNDFLGRVGAGDYMKNKTPSQAQILCDTQLKKINEYRSFAF